MSCAIIVTIKSVCLLASYYKWCFPRVLLAYKSTYWRFFQFQKRVLKGHLVWKMPGYVIVHYSCHVLNFIYALCRTCNIMCNIVWFSYIKRGNISTAHVLLLLTNIHGLLRVLPYWQMIVIGEQGHSETNASAQLFKYPTSISLNSFEEIQNHFVISTIYQPWYVTGSLNSFVWKTASRLFLDFQHRGCWWPGDDIINLLRLAL